MGKLENQIAEAIAKAQKDLMFKILKKAIGREPSQEDLLRIRSVAAPGKQQDNFVLIDNVIVGTFSYRFTGNGMAIDFMPAQDAHHNNDLKTPKPPIG